MNSNKVEVNLTETMRSLYAAIDTAKEKEGKKIIAWVPEPIQFPHMWEICHELVKSRYALFLMEAPNGQLSLVIQTTRVPIKNEETLGRNDPCFCMSGKKYKKCCGNTELKPSDTEVELEEPKS